MVRRDGTVVSTGSALRSPSPTPVRQPSDHRLRANTKTSSCQPTNVALGSILRAIVRLSAGINLLSRQTQPPRENSSSSVIRATSPTIYDLYCLVCAAQWRASCDQHSRTRSYLDFRRRARTGKSFRAPTVMCLQPILLSKSSRIADDSSRVFNARSSSSGRPLMTST